MPLQIPCPLTHIPMRPSLNHTAECLLLCRMPPLLKAWSITKRKRSMASRDNTTIVAMGFWPSEEFLLWLKLSEISHTSTSSCDHSLSLLLPLTVAPSCRRSLLPSLPLAISPSHHLSLLPLLPVVVAPSRRCSFLQSLSLPIAPFCPRYVLFPPTNSFHQGPSILNTQ